MADINMTRNVEILHSGRVGRVFAVASLIVAAAGFMPDATAAEPELVGIVALAIEEDVAQQLELTPSQKRQLRDLVIQREDAGLQQALRLKNLSPDERRQKLAPFRQETERLAMKLLSQRQRARLRQARLHNVGPAALVEPAIATSLELTDEQQEELARLAEKRSDALRTAPKSELEDIDQAFRQDLLAVLDENQQSQFQEMLSGKRTVPLRMVAQQLPGGRAAEETEQTPESSDSDDESGSDDGEVASARPDAAESQSTDSSDSEEQIEGNDRSEEADRTDENGRPRFAPQGPRGRFPRNQGNGGFRSRGDAPGFRGDRRNDSDGAESREFSRGAERSDVSDQVVNLPRSTDGKLRFSFRYQPWKDVIEWFAEEAGLSLQMDESPPDTLNYTDPRAYTPAEALDLINGILITKGFTLVRHGELLFVVKIADGVPPSLVPTVTAAELDELGDSELVSVIFDLQRLAVEDASAEIQPLIREHGNVVKLPRSKRLRVTETADRLRTIRQVLQEIEDPSSGTGDLVVIQLENRIADEVLPLIRDMLDIPPDANALPDGSLRIAVDLDGQRMVVRGTEGQIKRLREVLELIDVPLAGGSASALAQQPQFVTYSVGGASPEGVLQVLQTLLAGDPDARLQVDPGTGNLYALARPAGHAMIRATIDQMQRDGRQIEVIPLVTVDPQLAVVHINQIFGVDAENPSASAPKVQADPTTRSLLVRGSESQIQQIRGMLTQMGENTNASLANSRGGNVRVLPLSGREARSVLAQIEDIWPTMRTNPIRVMTPSSSSSIPTYRPNGESLPPNPNRSMQPHWPEDVDLTPYLQPHELRQRQDLENRASRESDADDQARRRQSPESDRTAARSAGQRVPVRFVQQTLSDDSDDSPEADSRAIPSSQQAPNAASSRSPVVVAAGPNGLVIASDDLEALDDLEDLLAAVGGRSAAGGRELAVYYLRFAKASSVGETLTQIFGGGIASGGGGAGLIGDIAGAALGDAGGIVSGLLGGGGGGGLIGGSIDVIPDDRLNALIIEAAPNDLATVEELLRILDQPGSPEDVQVDAPPRLIPVFNTAASNIATVVQSVYGDRIRGAGGQQQQPSPEDFIRALRGGGRGGRGGGGGNDRAQEEATKMTIGIDSRSNSLVVRAPDDLFQEVRILVARLDQAQSETSQVTQVVSLKGLNSSAVQEALSALYGNAIETSNTSSTSSGSSSNNNDGDAQRRAEEIRRRMEFFQRMRGQEGGRGGDTGGRGGGRGFGGGRGGDTGGRGGRGGRGG